MQQLALISDDLDERLYAAVQHAIELNGNQTVAAAIGWTEAVLYSVEPPAINPTRAEG